MTGLDLVKAALREIGIINAVDEPSAEDADFALGLLNRIVDNINAERGQVYADALLSDTLTPALSPHTIGPVGATWTVAQRPVAIYAASLVNGTTRTPLRVFTGLEHWSGLVDPETSGTPTELSYVAEWPLGACYFYPVPDAALTVELYARVVLSAFDLMTTITLPPGYQDAYILTLAEALTPAFGQAAQLSQMTVRNAAKARARIEANNAPSARIPTVDAGMPGSAGRGDIYTGLRV